jgi:hypothetical protein
MHLRVPRNIMQGLIIIKLISCSQQSGERRLERRVQVRSTHLYVVSQRSAAVSMTTYGGDEMVDVEYEIKDDKNK